MSQAALIFEKQGLHASTLLVLLAGLAVLGGFDAVRGGQLWGITTPVWFWLAAAIAVAHQVYVWFCWRTQLHGSLLTRVLGRPWVSPLCRGVLNSRHCESGPCVCSRRFEPGHAAGESVCTQAPRSHRPCPSDLPVPLGEALLGFRRAFGIDHFDESCRSLPYVRKGIFRFTRNGMYVYGFLLLWVPGFWFASLAALSVALFNHLYIWVHYFATELPDMKRIYGQAWAEAPNGDA